jgi:REP element-mobilizing transposase RayT
MSKYPRVPPRLGQVFANNPLYFVTLCTYCRRAILADSAVHIAFQEFTKRGFTERNIAVGRYVIMPDHIHLFVCGPDDFVLGRWIGSLKQRLAKAIKRKPDAHSIWQRGFFDHVLRNDESYGQKWQYVRDNPTRAGFVVRSEDYPYSGELVFIDRA